MYLLPRRTPLIALATGLIATFAASASAAPIGIVDNIEWFAEQGVKRNGSAITDPARIDPDSIFHANDNQWLSLGFVPSSATGGRVYGNTLPGFHLADVFEIREVTFGVATANYPEAVRVTFGGSLNGSADIIVDLGQTPTSCSAGLICSTGILNANTTQWLIGGLTGYQFTSVEIADITRPLARAVSDDGFDLDYVSAQTSPVPEPGSLALLACGGLMLGALRKRLLRSAN